MLSEPRDEPLPAVFGLLLAITGPVVGVKTVRRMAGVGLVSEWLGSGAGVGGRGLPKGTHEGHNDWKQPGYRGPCPPVGRHRYFFRLYALDCVLGDLGMCTKRDLLEAMRGHVLEQAELVGLYEKAAN
jgi:hypothetical protein